MIPQIYIKKTIWNAILNYTSITSAFQDILTSLLLSSIIDLKIGSEELGFLRVLFEKNINCTLKK